MKTLDTMPDKMDVCPDMNISEREQKYFQWASLLLHLREANGRLEEKCRYLKVIADAFVVEGAKVELQEADTEVAQWGSLPAFLELLKMRQTVESPSRALGAFIDALRLKDDKYKDLFNTKYVLETIMIPKMAAFAPTTEPALTYKQTVLKMLHDIVVLFRAEHPDINDRPSTMPNWEQQRPTPENLEAVVSMLRRLKSGADPFMLGMYQLVMQGMQSNAAETLHRYLCDEFKVLEDDGQKPDELMFAIRNELAAKFQRIEDQCSPDR